MRRWQRRLGKATLLATALGAACVAVSIPHATEGKFEPPASPPIEPPLAGEVTALHEIEAEAQTEGHTCGLHALRMAYASYGLDPDGYDLRARLGVDTPAIRWLESTTGMLPQDLFRVLDTDGFTWELVKPASEDAERKLRKHIESGVALAVVPYSSIELHWIVLRPAADGSPVILDPAGGSQRAFDAQAFLQDMALSVVLLGVREEAEPRPNPTAAGWAQMREVATQMAKRSKD